MNVVLFLYPIAVYVKHSCHNYNKTIARKQIKLFTEIISKRYREKGYTIAWVLFTKPDDPNKIDWKFVDRRLWIDRKNDLLILAGVPLGVDKDGVSEQELAADGIAGIPNWQYPDLHHIFKQLPREIDHLRIGGFHFSDCVSKAGEFAYKEWDLKDRVVVDEDITDLGWMTLQHAVTPSEENVESPRFHFVMEREMSYEGFGYTKYPDWETGEMWKFMRKSRNRSPWFVHK